MKIHILSILLTTALFCDTYASAPYPIDIKEEQKGSKRSGPASAEPDELKIQRLENALVAPRSGAADDETTDWAPKSEMDYAPAAAAIPQFDVFSLPAAEQWRLAIACTKEETQIISYDDAAKVFKRSIETPVISDKDKRIASLNLAMLRCRNLTSIINDAEAERLFIIYCRNSAKIREIIPGLQPDVFQGSYPEFIRSAHTIALDLQIEIDAEYGLAIMTGEGRSKHIAGHDASDILFAICRDQMNLKMIPFKQEDRVTATCLLAQMFLQGNVFWSKTGEEITRDLLQQLQKSPLTTAQNSRVQLALAMMKTYSIKVDTADEDTAAVLKAAYNNSNFSQRDRNFAAFGLAKMRFKNCTTIIDDPTAASLFVRLLKDKALTQHDRQCAQFYLASMRFYKRTELINDEQAVALFLSAPKELIGNMSILDPNLVELRDTYAWVALMGAAKRANRINDTNIEKILLAELKHPEYSANRSIVKLAAFWLAKMCSDGRTQQTTPAEAIRQLTMHTLPKFVSKQDMDESLALLNELKSKLPD